MTAAKKTTATDTNLFVLGKLVAADGTLPARVAPTEITHLRRCIAAGLVDVVGGVCTVNDAGRAALAARAARFAR